MKSHLFARSLPLLAGLGFAAGPALLAQTTNLINDGTTIANLTLLANSAGTAGATLSLEPDGGALRAAQSANYPDFPLNGVWFAKAVRPATNAYTILADVRPSEAFPENVLGVMGWLDATGGKGITFRVVPGTFGALQVAVVDFQAESAEANDSSTGLFNLDGTEAQPLYGSAWGALGEYDAAAFATLSLSVQPATAADLTVVTNATARLIARAYQGDNTPVGDPIQLLTSLPLPVEHRLGYTAKLDTLFVPGAMIGHVKNLRVTGEIEVINQPPTVALTTPPDGAQFFAPANVTLTAEAADPDGAVARVEFRQGANLLGSVATLPATLTVSNLAVGNYTFTAVAFDVAGESGESAPVSIQVVAAPEPTLEGAQVIPGPDGMSLLKLTVVGTAGLAYEAQVTFDLITWLAIGTGTLAQDRVELTFPSYSDAGLAYYRVQAAKPPGQANQSPTVSITRPASGATFLPSASFEVVAAGQDSDGEIARIELYVGTRLVGSAGTSPATASVSGLAQGTYQLTARAYDKGGAGSISPPVRIEVAGQVTPPQLAAPTLLPSAADFAQFQFTATGLAGSGYRVESSTNLKDWTPAETGAITGPTRQFTFPRTTGGNLLFYRLVNLP